MRIYCFLFVSFVTQKMDENKDIIFLALLIFEKKDFFSGGIPYYLVCMDIKFHLFIKKFLQQVIARLASVEDEIFGAINNFFFLHPNKRYQSTLPILN